MTSFSDLGIKEFLLKSITEVGYETPTPVQEKAIPLLLEKKSDVVALAQTGTGKTAAFGLPLLSLVDVSKKETQGLILSPTRELAVQIANELNTFAKYEKKISIVTVYGGANINAQIKDLRRGATIIVATPGRLNDLIRRKEIRLDNIEYVVLDEADEMLNMGFKEEIDFALATTPEDKSVWLFSATMAKEVRAIAKNYMTDPEEIQVGTANIGNKNINHKIVLFDRVGKYETLKRILAVNPDLFGVLFCRTKAETNDLADKLGRDGYRAGAINGDLSQNQRDHIMEQFRRRQIDLLVATDVAARGIDVNDVTHVLHYNIPDEIEFFTHRSGRTARAGKQGESILIASKRDKRRVGMLQSKLKIDFEDIEVPSVSSLLEVQAKAWASHVKEGSFENEKLLTMVEVAVGELQEVSKEDLIKNILANQFKQMLTEKPRQERNDREDRRGEGRRDRRDRREGRSERRDRDRRDRDTHSDRRERGSRDYTMIKMNVGREEGIGKKEFLEFVCDISGVHRKAIGDIEMKKGHTVFQVESDKSSKVWKRFEGVQVEGTPVKLEEVETRKRKRN